MRILFNQVEQAVIRPLVARVGFDPATIWPDGPDSPGAEVLRLRPRRVQVGLAADLTARNTPRIWHPYSRRVLFQARFWPLITDGSVTVTFRRWKRRQVVAGHRYRTGHRIVGRIMIEVDDVREVDPSKIMNADARRAGFPDAATLVGQLRGEPGFPVYRIAFHVVDEPDPRSVLSASSELTLADREDIQRRLDRLDRASTHGPWTRAVLQVIAGQPATRAADLAAGFGRETQPFKTDVRKLKNLGLTESLEVGYRLSPRGRAYLEGGRP